MPHRLASFTVNATLGNTLLVFHSLPLSSLIPSLSHHITHHIITRPMPPSAASMEVVPIDQLPRWGAALPPAPDQPNAPEDDVVDDPLRPTPSEPSRFPVSPELNAIVSLWCACFTEEKKRGRKLDSLFFILFFQNKKEGDSPSCIFFISCSVTSTNALQCLF